MRWHHLYLTLSTLSFAAIAAVWTPRFLSIYPCPHPSVMLVVLSSVQFPLPSLMFSPPVLHAAGAPRAAPRVYGLLAWAHPRCCGSSRRTTRPARHTRRCRRRHLVVAASRRPCTRSRTERVRQIAEQRGLDPDGVLENVTHTRPQTSEEQCDAVRSIVRLFVFTSPPPRPPPPIHSQPLVLAACRCLRTRR